MTVDSVRGDSIHGHIDSNLDFVRGYRVGQPIVLSTDAVLDWTVSRPDGTEEGNRIGKYLDKLHARLQQRPQRKPC